MPALLHMGPASEPLVSRTLRLRMGVTLRYVNGKLEIEDVRWLQHFGQSLLAIVLHVGQSIRPLKLFAKLLVCVQPRDIASGCKTRSLPRGTCTFRGFVL